MSISLKLKLRLALIFIFGLLLAVVVASHFALFQITERTKNIFRANHESLEFVEQMRDALDNGDLPKFESALQKQEANITEAGETEATAGLRTAYNTLKNKPSDGASRHLALRYLADIHQLNRAAIIRANDDTYRLTSRFSTWLSVLGTVAVLLAFILIFNFPDYIANPVERLTEGIRQIARKNYEARIHEHSHDEFGEMTHAFNNMAERLEQWEKSSMAAILKAKRRVEGVISLFPDALIGLDEQQKILFINPAAAHLLALKPESITGTPAADVAAYNDLLRELLQAGSASRTLQIFSDGHERSYESAPYNLQDDEGENIGSVILLRIVKSL